MGIASGTLAHIDFENYSLGRILGQGTPPYIWSEHDTTGGPLDATDAFNIIDSDAWSGGSGLIANKYTTDTVELDRLSFLVLQSGIPTDKQALTYRWSMSVNEADAHQFENDLLLRPSGAIFEGGNLDNDLRCIRVQWYHIGTEPNYRLTVKSKLSTTTLFFQDYFIERSRNINNIEFLVEDTGSNIKVYANASGMFELTHDIDTEDFNYHEPSGAFLVRNNAGLCNTSLNDISFGYYDTEILHSSGYIGGYIEVPDSAWVSGYIGAYTQVNTPVSGAHQEASNEDFGQTGGFSFPDFSTIYEAIFDASFASGPARTITLHLEPILSAASGTVVTHDAFRFNPFFGEAERPAPVERNAGAHREERFVQYTAHVKHGPTAIDDDSTPLGRLFANEVQTTLDIGSETHVRDAIFASIDGRMYKMSRGPRPIGWSTAKYLIVVWEEVSEVQDGAD